MRQSHLLPRSFFWDGPAYTLTSSSHGGHATTEEVAAAIDTEAPEEAQRLTDAGAMLHLVFEGDCMLDKAAVVVGELTAQEQEEWVGRIRTRLSIPCGRFVLMGGGREPDDYDPEFSEAVHVVEVPPGDYDVQVLFYASSYRGNAFLGDDVEAHARWSAETRPGEPEPLWLRALREDPDSLPAKDTLVDTLIHLAPASGPRHTPKVASVESVGSAVEETELRRPARIPLGIPRSAFAPADGADGEDGED
jgi:hypothetical protein